MAPSRSGSSARERASCASGSQAVASKPRLGPQNGMVSDEAKARTSSLTPWVKGALRWAGATPHTRSATWGTSNRVRMPCSTACGTSAAQRTPASWRAHWCTLPAMAAFSLLWRTISMTRCSSSLILSRSISAWRSCRLTARWPCGLAKVTEASSSAWRSKKPGVAARYWAMSSSVMGVMGRVMAVRRTRWRPREGRSRPRTPWWRGRS